MLKATCPGSCHVLFSSPSVGQGQRRQDKDSSGMGSAGKYDDSEPRNRAVKAQARRGKPGRWDSQHVKERARVKVGPQICRHSGSKRRQGVRQTVTFEMAITAGKEKGMAMGWLARRQGQDHMNKQAEDGEARD